MATAMIRPHGSDPVNPLYLADDAQRAALAREAEALPALTISSAAAANAVFRQNCGCTHLIAGRDHASVGKYYSERQMLNIAEADGCHGRPVCPCFAGPEHWQSRRAGTSGTKYVQSLLL